MVSGDGRLEIYALVKYRGCLHAEACFLFLSLSFYFFLWCVARACVFSPFPTLSTKLFCTKDSICHCIWGVSKGQMLDFMRCVLVCYSIGRGRKGWYGRWLRAGQGTG